MPNIKHYLYDGANHQTKAVLAYLSQWDSERKQYLAEPKVARWENCREQGYVVSIRSQDYSRQFNVIFFEHRNSDSICAVKWEQCSTNSPTINTADFGKTYKNKYDVSFEVGYGEVVKMSDWIWSELTNFWRHTKTAIAKEV